MVSSTQKRVRARSSASRAGTSANAAANATRDGASGSPPASRANDVRRAREIRGRGRARTPSASRRGSVANSAGTAWRYGSKILRAVHRDIPDAANPAPVQSQRAPSRIVAAASMSGPPSAAASARRAYASGTAAAIDATSGESGRTDARVLPSSRSCVAGQSPARRPSQTFKREGEGSVEDRKGGDARPGERLDDESWKTRRGHATRALEA